MNNFNIGFKALAYPVLHVTSGPVSPCPCSLAFKYDDASKQATLLLVATVPSTAPRSSCDTHNFVLQYDADLLLPGSTRLTSGSTSLPQLNDILRDKDDRRTQIKTLTLSIQQPCPIWCPDHPSFAHKPDSELLFRQFVDLTTATEIHIVFDYKHLRKEHQKSFKAFSKAAKGLTGYPVKKYLSDLGLRQASWDVFEPVDAPPAYNPRKRSRQASTSPIQSPKRFAPQSPTESLTSDKTVPLSPAAAEALKAAVGKEPGFDYQSEAINIAVNKQLTTHLKTILPTLLPDILPTLFASAPPSTSPTTTSFDSSATTPSPKPPPLTPLGESLLPYLRTHLHSQFQQYQTHQLAQFQHLLDRLWDAAEGTRAHETAEIIDDICEHKSDILLLEKDALAELARETDAVFERARQEGCELSDFLAERLEDSVAGLCDRIEALKRVEVGKMVRCEVRRYERRRKKGVQRGVGRRSLVRGGRKLLGREREVEVSEWVDC